MSTPLLDVRNLSIDVATPAGAVRLVNDVSFSLNAGEMLGVVGESGSGKSLICRALIGLLPPRLTIAGGTVLINGKDVTNLTEKDLVDVRGRDIGMIFQNPSAYLNPVMKVGEQISEALRAQDGLSKREARQEAINTIRQVGIPDPEARVDSYIHEFSGGMRQRVMIAAGIVRKPKIIIADEPTTALDVTVQAQILRLLLELRDSLGLSIIIVTHDLGVVAQTCDTVAVVYAGRLMETGPCKKLITRPGHPYTEALIKSQPGLTEAGHLLPCIEGQPPQLANCPKGCLFEPRCAKRLDICHQSPPELVQFVTGRYAACYLTQGEVE